MPLSVEKPLKSRSGKSKQMSGFCPKCGKELASAARFCAVCGEANTRVAGQNPVQSQTEIKSAKGQGTALGCLTGWGVSGCLVPVGVLLCFTGIGAIIGIPILIAGLAALVIGPLLGLGTKKGKCPWCGSVVMSAFGSRGFDCPVCKNRIVVRNTQFIKIV
jgi:hypothetical protein